MILILHTQKYRLYSHSHFLRINLLSQWRGYCPEGGCSLSFEQKQLGNFVEKNQLRIQPCLYDKVEIEKHIVKKIVGMDPEEYQKFVDNPLYNKRKELMPYELVYKVFRNIPFIKHDAFSEEKEWRIVNYEHHKKEINQLSKLKLRAGKNRIIPYLEYSFDGIGKGFINEAILSPREPDSLAVESVKILLQLDSVSQSTIPYRT